MTHKHDGGPAFPDPGRAQSAKQRGLLGNPGMSLRDYFAAKAMQGIVTHEDMWNQLDSTIAESAYALADAMLAQREK